jgi:raffinose/stachyose/melibiose transport system permease protein
MFAGILIMLIPTIVAFLLASRQFIQGLTQGGLKE